MANGAVAFLGGIPGAQATIRSVLLLNENATWRIFVVFVGVLVLLEMLLLQDFVSPIPQSVFAGILFKVGYDVFDWAPVATFWRQLKKATVPDAGNSMPPLVSDSSQEMFFIMGTTPVTVVANLNIAVVGFTVLFYVGSRFRGFTDLDHLEGAPQLAD